MKELYTLYIDGGSTTTKVYIMNDKKEIILKNIFDGLNLQTRFDKSLNTIIDIVEWVKSISNKFNIFEICIGAPGIEQCLNIENVKNELKKISDKINIYFLTDIEIQERMFCYGESYIVISFGSGTIMHTLNKENKRRYFGWGHMISDPCSAYAFSLFWIKKAIIDFENNDSESKYIKETTDFFNINSIEEIKNFYTNLNDFKFLFQKFAIKILIDNELNRNDEIRYVSEEMVKDFFQHFDQLNIDKEIEKVFLLGGMVKNKNLKNLLKYEFEKRNYIIE